MFNSIVVTSSMLFNEVRKENRINLIFVEESCRPITFEIITMGSLNLFYSSMKIFFLLPWPVSTDGKLRVLVRLPYRSLLAAEIWENTIFFFIIIAFAL